MKIQFLVLVLFFGATRSSVFKSQPKDTRYGEDQCLEKSSNTILQHGESKNLTTICAKATCNVDGSIVWEGCDVMVTNEKRVYDVEDLQPYPLCCPSEYEDQLEDDVDDGHYLKRLIEKFIYSEK